MNADETEWKPDRADIAIAAMLMTLRAVRKVSQGELARALGVSCERIERFERGQEPVSASLLYHIA